MQSAIDSLRQIMCRSSSPRHTLACPPPSSAHHFCSTYKFSQGRGWTKRGSAKLLGVAQGTQMTPLLGGLPPLHLEILGPSEATLEDLHFPQIGTCPKAAHKSLDNHGELGDGTYGVLTPLLYVSKWVTNIWLPLMGYWSSGAPKICHFGSK